jgi:hypothetical protein
MFQGGKLSEERLERTLKQFLEEGREWERRPTSIAGVFILKLPSYKGSPQKLSVEINPIDASGNPTKKRGLVIRSLSELREFRQLLNDDKLERVMSGVERVNPPATKVLRPKKEAGVIEV